MNNLTRLSKPILMQFIGIGNLYKYLKCFFIICSLLISLLANAQYPASNKSITIIVPFKEGGSTDKITRIIAEPLAKELGTYIAIKNISGLGGSIGTTEVKQSAADGYTLGILTLSSFATYPALNANAAYNPITDFTYIVNIAQSPHILVINPKFAARDFKGFIAQLKQTTKPYVYASSGSGSMPNLLMEYMQKLTNTKMVHKPFVGASSGVKSVVLGKELIMLDQAASVINLINEQKLIALAVGNDKRLEFLPAVPTFSELGYPQLNRIAFYGLIAPAGVAPEIVEKLNTAVNKILKSDEIIKQIQALGYGIKGGTDKQFAQDTKVEIDAYKKIITSEIVLEEANNP